MLRATIVFVLGLPVLSAQTTGSMQGVVVGPAGGVITGARVQIRNTATEATADATSSAAGSFVFSELAPGTYNLLITHPGFRVYVAQSIKIVAGEARNFGRLPMALPPIAPDVVMEMRGTIDLSLPVSALEIPLCLRFPNNPVLVYESGALHVKFPNAQQQ